MGGICDNPINIQVQMQCEDTGLHIGSDRAVNIKEPRAGNCEIRDFSLSLKRLNFHKHISGYQQQTPAAVTIKE